jgi:hypothetical protein
MEGTRTLAAVVAEASARLEDLLLGETALFGEGDLLAVERGVQQVLRQVGGVVVSGVLQQRAQGAAGEAAGCPRCGRRLQVVGRARQRTVVGLVGEYRFARPTLHCASCHAGHAPLDAALGLGDARLSPGLAQVVCQQAQQVPFAEASASVQGSLGVFVDGETVRRRAAGLGRLIEQDQGDRARWAVPDEAVPACLLVEVDGVHTPLLDGYHETKVGRVGALGPQVTTDPETGRATLALQPSSFCTGLESTDDFSPRLIREAFRAGFTRGVRRVVFLGDGAAWIWHQVRTQFSHPGVEVVEIVDFYHAAEHLGEVATAVYGAGTLRASAWLADQKHALLHHGAAPVLQALAAFTGLDARASEVVRRNHTYFTDRAARMDYPAFSARQFPIGSGAVESSCKVLIAQREKGAGMRWSAPGAQYIANLRALYRSAPARWAVWWASRPLARLHLLPPRAAVAPSTGAAVPAEAAVPVPVPAAPAPPTSPVAPTTRIATAGKPWAKGPDHWRRQSISHKRSA